MRRNLTSEEFYEQYRKFLEGNAKTTENGTEIGSKEYFDSLHREISNELTELDIRIASTKERLRVAEAEEKLEAEKLTLETENFKAAKERADRAWKRYTDAVNNLAAELVIPGDFEERRQEIKDLEDYANYCRKRLSESPYHEVLDKHFEASEEVICVRATLDYLENRRENVYQQSLQIGYYRRVSKPSRSSAQLDTSCIV